MMASSDEHTRPRVQSNANVRFHGVVAQRRLIVWSCRAAVDSRHVRLGPRRPSGSGIRRWILVLHDPGGHSRTHRGVIRVLGLCKSPYHRDHSTRGSHFWPRRSPNLTRGRNTWVIQRESAGPQTLRRALLLLCRYALVLIQARRHHHCCVGDSRLYRSGVSHVHSQFGRADHQCA